MAGYCSLLHAKDEAAAVHAGLGGGLLPVRLNGEPQKALASANELRSLPACLRLLAIL
jgi:hypothetical protein